MSELGYLDFHTHILPGVDDGAKSEDMTKEMLRMAYNQGVRTMLATSHNYPGKENASVEKLTELCGTVQQWAKEIGEDFKILPGNEIFYRKSVCEELEENKILTLGGSNYVLIEFSPYEKFSKIYDGMKELVNSGYYPVVAHMERVECLLTKPEHVRDLIKLGCYIQVNCESLFGGMFDSTTSKILKYMKNGCVHFLGSDCHNVKSRAPVMQDCVKRLYKKLPKDVVDKILYYNQQRFLEGKYIK